MCIPLVLDTVVGSRSLVESATEVVDVMGLTPDPFAAWLALRGAHTLALRMERPSHNALVLARALEKMPGVDTVYYPPSGHAAFGPSLGDVSTMISHPVVASHHELTFQEKEAAAIDERACASRSG